MIDFDMSKHFTPKEELERITFQEEKIMRLLKEERKLVQQKFPLPYAFLAFFGFVSTWAGLYKIIQEVEFLNDNPIILIILGLSILVITGAAYRKLG